ncbi:hypothetical protein PCANC_08510 [Puccinia coronata f. sp. avenae]|uniref:Copia protein n=1 Tax=Puccinia coronata f. sp. avenae TaxID=200324 RepID=A0A2N5V950_9BASI|nr:hypothetical protein PCANC_08510 [Puccinia coronata f. sp. avenae]
MNTLSDGVQENQWVKFVVEELWDENLEPTTFNVNNMGLVEKVKNFGSNSKTKHLNLKLKWIRDLKNNNEISVKLIPSKEMFSNALIKACSAESLQRLRAQCFLAHLSPD